MGEIRIRERQAGDLDACVAALALVYAENVYPTNWPADPARWLAPATTMHGWVAVAGSDTDTGDESVLGHVIVQSGGDPGIAHVSRLFVTPGARGTGLGARMLEQATDWAAAEGLGLALEVVDHEGSAAIALYERAGWRRVRSAPATWTTRDGGVVLLHYYVRGESTSH